MENAVLELGWGLAGVVIAIVMTGFWVGSSIDNIATAVDEAKDKYSEWVDEQIRVSQLQCPEFEDETITLEDVMDALREEGAPSDHVTLDRIQSVVDKIESERSE